MEASKKLWDSGNGGEGREDCLIIGQIQAQWLNREYGLHFLPLQFCSVKILLASVHLCEMSTYVLQKFTRQGLRPGNSERALRIK